MLVEAYGLPPGSAGGHVAVFAVGCTLARPLGGYVSDHVGGRRVLYGVFPAVTKLIAERFSRGVGAVSGLAGAIGSLGGLLLPVARGLGQDLIGSYVFGFLLLAAPAIVGPALHARPGAARSRG